MNISKRLLLIAIEMRYLKNNIFDDKLIYIYIHCHVKFDEISIFQDRIFSRSAAQIAIKKRKIVQDLAISRHAALGSRSPQI